MKTRPVVVVGSTVHEETAGGVAACGRRMTPRTVRSGAFGRKVVMPVRSDSSVHAVTCAACIKTRAAADAFMASIVSPVAH